jgi:hypothetical protein
MRQTTSGGNFAALEEDVSLVRELFSEIRRSETGMQELAQLSLLGPGEEAQLALCDN